VPVARSGLDGQTLPFEDDSYDAALSTWTLCTVPDAVGALGELRRVLKPGGTLHFLEHGLAPDEQVRRWQHRLEPVQKRLFGGCHLTRPIVDLLRTAGFTITDSTSFTKKALRSRWAPTPWAPRCLPSVSEGAHARCLAGSTIRTLPTGSRGRAAPTSRPSHNPTLYGGVRPASPGCLSI
jgi:SAM-dependent methyltransferase